ncbi:MAG: hypothetical protein WAV18_03905, partial [Roseiarcus sp.]
AAHPSHFPIVVACFSGMRCTAFGLTPLFPAACRRVIPARRGPILLVLAIVVAGIIKRVGLRNIQRLL